MPSKVPSAHRHSQYRSQDRVRYADPVQVQLARLLGARTPGAAWQRVLRALPVIRAYAEACRLAGSTVRLTSLILELSQARAAVRPPDGQITLEEWQTHAAADRLEDTSREDFQLLLASDRARALDGAIRLDRALVREIDAKTAFRADVQQLITRLEAEAARC